MRRPLILLAALALALAPAAVAQEAGPGRLTLSFLDVGQGDAILVQTPEGKTALIDAGPSQHVVPLLRARGVRSLDLLVISHHHADHYGGAAAVVEAFPPRAFLATDSTHSTARYLKLLELIRDRGIRAVFAGEESRRIELGSVTLTTLPKAPVDPSEENNNSIGLRLQYGTFSALLPGDAEGAERSWWLDHARDLCEGCTVLKLAHHGSRNGTDRDWLRAVRPRLAVASLGLDNGFHHPHPSTLALLSYRRIPLLRTDRDGTITVTSDGRRWSVVEGRESSRAPPESEPDAPAADPGGKVDLNAASEARLQTLPGIGPVLARRIVEGRPYASLDDLRRVKGIGPKHLAEIRDLAAAGVQ